MLKPPLAALFAPFCYCVPLAAQEVPGWTLHELPGAAVTVLAVAYEAGYDLDAPGECGACRVVVECRLERARAAVPGTKASGVHVDGGAVVAFVMVEGDRWQQALQFVLALQDQQAPLSDDVIARVAARTALVADDAEWLYPGEVLASSSRRALWAGTPLAHSLVGAPLALQALSVARVRELLKLPTARRGLGLGALPPALGAELAKVELATGPWRLAGPAANPVAAPAKGLESIGNPRTDAVFLTAAFAVPPEVDRAALALLLEVARVRALRTLPPRREEALARAPRIAWSWLHGDPVVLCTRRGSYGPSMDRPQKELERLLADLRERPVSAEELAKAAQAVDFELSLPPWSDARKAAMAAASGALPGRAITILLAERRGIEAGATAAVTVDSVAQTVAMTLAPGRASWFAVVPTTTLAAPLPGGGR